MARIEVRGLSHTYTDRSGNVITAVHDVSLDIEPGRFITIVGPSGCGKTTLLNVVAGFIPASKGTVRIDGRPITEPGPERGVVFQSFALFDWLTVRENIEFGPRMAEVDAGERAERSNKYLALIGLRKFADRYPYELSGGMKQRVAIARALANDPDVLLMDEPFAALDAQTRELMQEELLRIWETTKKTVLFITHSIEEAVYLSTDVAVMTYRPGKLKRIFSVSLPYPRSDYSIRTAPEFLQLKLAIHELVREEIMKHAGEGS
jgi:ABC-type nitrate/sulfonate/bicarbonate transport system ATPase subunit